MAANQLLWGRINAGTVFSELQGANQFIRVNGTVTTGQTQITSVTDVGGDFFGQSVIRPGMVLVASGAFPSGTTIISVDTGNNTITVADAAASDLTGGLCRVNCGSGMAFIESGSLERPSGVTDWDIRTVTGSNDSEYQEGRLQWAILAQAASPDGNTSRIGNFGQFQIFDVQERQQNLIGNFFITSSGGDMNGFSGSFNFKTGDTIFAIYQIGPENQAGPIFDTSDLTGIETSYGFGPYQVAASNLMNALTSGSGGGDAFPFTGSAQITGSLGITGSAEFVKGEGNTDFFLIKSSSFSSLTLNSDGVAIFGNFSSLPTAVEGGFAYSASNFYAGIE